MHSCASNGERSSWPSNFRTHPLSSIALFLALGFVFCGALPSKKHHVLLEDEAPQCTEALTGSRAYQQGTVAILRPELRDHYRWAPSQEAASTYPSMWAEAYTQWRQAEFDRALELSKKAPDAMLTQPVFGVDPSLRALMQLRITILLLQGETTRADTEAMRALSRGTAEYYCSSNDFPEACNHLRTIESSQALPWSDAEDFLRPLSDFSTPQARTLSVMSSESDQVRLTLVEAGERTRQHVWNEDCTRPEFWSSMLKDWEDLVLTPPALRPVPPPRKAIALDRTLRIGVPIAAALVAGAAIGTTLLMHQRREYFDRCAARASVCPREEDINDAFRGWLRARAWTAVTWTTFGAVGLSPIPLTLFKKRAIRRAQRTDLDNANR